MTTPNIEELRKLAEDLRDVEGSHPRWLAECAFKSAFNYGTALALLDQLQSQAERIKELEAEHKECIKLLGEALQDTTDVAIERDALAAKLVESIANHEACKSANTMLLAELAEIEGQEPAPQPAQGGQTKVLLEHSGCGHGKQMEQLNIGLHRGDKVVLVMGAYTAAVEDSK